MASVYPAGTTVYVPSWVLHDGSTTCIIPRFCPFFKSRDDAAMFQRALTTVLFDTFAMTPSHVLERTITDEGGIMIDGRHALVFSVDGAAQEGVYVIGGALHEHMNSLGDDDDGVHVVKLRNWSMN